MYFSTYGAVPELSFGSVLMRFVRRFNQKIPVLVPYLCWILVSAECFLNPSESMTLELSYDISCVLTFGLSLNSPVGFCCIASYSQRNRHDKGLIEVIVSYVLS